MTVGELIELLSEFPPELPVFFTPDTTGHRAVAPVNVVKELVHPLKCQVLDDDDPWGTVPPGFADALVIRSSGVKQPIELALK